MQVILSHYKVYKLLPWNFLRCLALNFRNDVLAMRSGHMLLWKIVLQFIQSNPLLPFRLC